MLWLGKILSVYSFVTLFTVWLSFILAVLEKRVHALLASVLFTVGVTVTYVSILVFSPVVSGIESRV